MHTHCATNAKYTVGDNNPMQTMINKNPIRHDANTPH